MKEKFSLDREFIRWFYEEPYPEEGKNRSGTQEYSYGLTPNVETRDYWMRQAYKAGASAMAQDILNALMDWATAVEGLDPEMFTPAEVYDRARENLFVYVTNKLDAE